jgi:RNA polymerase sigma factor (sigma-70 family)
MASPAEGNGQPPEHRSLAKRLRDGDFSVLGDILRTFGPLIQGTFRRKFEGGLNYHDIEDILSDAICKLWKKPKDYDPTKGSFQTYFVTICLHVALDVLRSKWHRARRLEVHLGDKARHLSASGRGTPDDQAARDARQSEEIQALIMCVGRLKPSWQQIIWAGVCENEEASSSQILGKELGVSGSTIRVRRMRALNELRKEMSDLGFE